MSYLKKDHRGCLVYVSSTLTAVETPSKEVTTLDLTSITRTVASIKSWLASEPSKEDAQAVFEYEKSESNRVSAVGEEGCLTLFLQGE